VTTAPDVDVVVPTIGRPSLRVLLESLGRSRGSRPARVTLVDDRPDPVTPLVALHDLGWLGDRLRVIGGPGRGPAAARNVGWRAARAAWVAFLDDDVVVASDWLDALARDLGALEPTVAGSQGRIVVPLPADRRPTDWERNVAGLERAKWATADLAYRRRVLEEVGGFDERFPRAYREDADLGLRVVDAGYRIVRGTREVQHPVRPAGPWTSVTLQRGNADDVLMAALHGPEWRVRASAPPGRFRRHAATVAFAGVASAAVACRRPRLAGTAALGWIAATAELAWARIEPGPRVAGEVARMAVTSAVLPFAAVAARAHGIVTLPARLRDTERAPRPATAGRDVGVADRPAAVLLDRDGTLVVDVPYNGDASRVQPVAGAREALGRLRAAGIPLAVVSNQSGVARGLLTPEQVLAVNARVDELLGPLGPFLACLHGEDDGCTCRKPAPGLVLQAADRLGVAPERCVVIGDTAADLGAAESAGARGILVPNLATRREEIAAAAEVASDLASAVDLVLASTAATATAGVAP
jgi:histidinol-phosphate phosphatase family protein